MLVQWSPLQSYRVLTRGQPPTPARTLWSSLTAIGGDWMPIARPFLVMPIWQKPDQQPHTRAECQLVSIEPADATWHSARVYGALGCPVPHPSLPELFVVLWANLFLLSIKVTSAYFSTLSITHHALQPAPWDVSPPCLWGSRPCLWRSGGHYTCLLVTN